MKQHQFRVSPPASFTAKWYFLGVIRKRFTLRLAFLIATAAASGLRQVQVNLRTNQTSYLAGEPIFVVVDVENIGTEPVAYSGCDGHADLTVSGGQKKLAPNLLGCFLGVGRGYGCGFDHPPLMKSGQTITFWYLLQGYNLRAGDYILHASGKAGVRWKILPYVRPRHQTATPKACGNRSRRRIDV